MLDAAKLWEVVNVIGLTVSRSSANRWKRSLPRSTTFRRRVGVTLLEVLFAVGVVLIGVLAVAALVPLALYHSGRGNTSDRAATLGISGRHNFVAYGLSNPLNWRLPNGAPVYNPARIPAPPHLDFGLPGGAYLPGGAFLIDPEFVASNFAATTAHFNAAVFPYYTQLPYSNPPNPGNVLEARCRRLSLVPSNRAPTAAIATFPMLRGAQARNWFSMHDELVNELPSDKILPPISKYETIYPGPDGQWGQSGVDDNSDGVIDDSGEALALGSDDFAGRRSFEGTFSWMAMLVPKRDQAGSNRDEYTMSVIVMQRRDPTMRPFLDDNGNGAFNVGEIETGNERLVDVMDMPGLGMGGGEVTLAGRPNGVRPPSVEDLEVRSGDWLLLTGTYGPSPAAVEFKWYRVVASDDVNTGSSPFTRSVTLLGPDWPIIPAAGTAWVQATIVPGVITVQEEVVRLDSVMMGNQ